MLAMGNCYVCSKKYSEFHIFTHSYSAFSVKAVLSLFLCFSSSLSASLPLSFDLDSANSAFFYVSQFFLPLLFFLLLSHTSSSFPPCLPFPPRLPSLSPHTQALPLIFSLATFCMTQTYNTHSELMILRMYSRAIED